MLYIITFRNKLFSLTVEFKRTIVEFMDRVILSLVICMALYFYEDIKLFYFLLVFFRFIILIIFGKSRIYFYIYVFVFFSFLIYSIVELRVYNRDLMPETFKLKGKVDYPFPIFYYLSLWYIIMDPFYMIILYIYHNLDL